LAVTPSNQLLGKVLFWDTNSSSSSQEINQCHGAREFVFPCTRARNWSHFWARWTPSSSSHDLLTPVELAQWRGLLPCGWLNIYDENLNRICYWQGCRLRTRRTLLTVCSGTLPDYLYEDILGKFVTQPFHVACVESTCSLQYFITLQYYVICFSVIFPFALKYRKWSLPSDALLEFRVQFTYSPFVPHATSHYVFPPPPCLGILLGALVTKTRPWPMLSR
jgi:hypothetical protein